MRHDVPPTNETPELAPGLNVLDVPRHRSPALHRVVLDATAGSTDETVWVDARNNAVSRLLRHPASRRRFAGVRLARAFTAYQHHELIRTLPGEVTADTPLIVVPCVTSLYRDDDVPAPEDAHYLRASVAVLSEVADTFDVPVLASCVDGAGEMRDVVGEYTAKEIGVEETDLGYRFEADGFRTSVYRQRGYWQTTIPYWVDLLGAVEGACSVETAVDRGLLEATAPP